MFYRGLKVNRWLSTVSVAFIEGSCTKDQQMCDKYFDKLKNTWIHMSKGHCPVPASPCLLGKFQPSIFYCHMTAYCTIVTGLEPCCIVCLELCPCWHWCHSPALLEPGTSVPTITSILTFVTTRQLFSHAWLYLLEGFFKQECSYLRVWKQSSI